MMQAVDLHKYQDFVQGITSAESEDLPTFIERLNALDANVGGPAFNVPLLITAGIGLGSEAGEFEEIVKKVLFQGKVIAENVTKLESRYPGGEFDVFSSENREAGDL